MTNSTGMEASRARISNCLLGGKSNYEADADTAGALKNAFPQIEHATRADHAFMLRAAKALAAEGVDQFLVLGAGMPIKLNLHQAAQSIVPHARVLYVDNDAVAVAHARALHTATATDAGRIGCLQADFTQPQEILDAPERRATLDLSRPIAVVATGILHFLSDQHRPHHLLDTLLDAAAPGTYLVASCATADFDPDGAAAAGEVYTRRGITFQPRTLEEFARFFTGRVLIEPGITVTSRWRPLIASAPDIASTSTDSQDPDTDIASARDARCSAYAGVARTPVPPPGWR